MRAPPASNRPTIGARAFIAMSWIFWIFNACVSESEPPNTVKSLANTNTVRPFTVPQPITTPSPGILAPLSMPNSVARCSTNMSNSSNESLSIRSSTRSRAVSLPRLCCASMRAFPPPRRALARRSSSFSRMSFIVWPIPLPGLTTLSLARELGNLALSSPGGIHHGSRSRRRRRGNAAPALAHRGLSARPCGALCLPPGRRLVVAVRRAYFAAGRELCRLPRQHARRRDRLQHDARDTGPAAPRRARFPAAVIRPDRGRAALGGAARRRPRTRLRPEIWRRLRPHPSRPHRRRADGQLGNFAAGSQDEDQHLGDGAIEAFRNILTELDLRQRLGERRVLLDRHAVLGCQR